MDRNVLYAGLMGALIVVSAIAIWISGFSLSDEARQWIAYGCCVIAGFCGGAFLYTWFKLSAPR